MRCFLLFFFILFPLITIANVSVWHIIPNQSSITFTAIQNNSPVMGQFKSFTGDIHFNPARLDESSVNIVIDTGSVTTSYGQVADTLKTPDWFDVKIFPQASFKSNAFKKINNNTYEADGTLTIRDKTLPIVLTFSLDEYTKTSARAHGKAVLKRTAFGIGKGEWANTDSIKDAVQVDFTISATQQ